MLLIRACSWGQTLKAMEKLSSLWPSCRWTALDQETRFWKEEREWKIEEVFQVSDQGLPEPIFLRDVKRKFKNTLCRADFDGAVILSASDSFSGLSNLFRVARWIARGHPVWLIGPSLGPIRLSLDKWTYWIIRDGLTAVLDGFLFFLSAFFLLPLFFLLEILFQSNRFSAPVRGDKISSEFLILDGLSVVILSFNTKEILRKCFQSLREKAPEIEVIVVDNASNDGSAAMIRKDFPWAHLIENKENAGFAAGCNIGMRAAKTEYICFLNSDTELIESPFERLKEHLKGHPECGAVTSRIVSFEGAVYKNLWRGEQWLSILDRSFLRERWGNSHWYRRWLNRWIILEEKEYDKEQRELASFSFSFGMFRLEEIRKMGGLDERFFMYFEDQDLCLRMRQAGRKIHFLPEGRIRHLGKGSQSDSQIGFRYFCDSRIAFFRKHGLRALVPVAKWLSFLGRVRA